MKNVLLAVLLGFVLSGCGGGGGDDNIPPPSSGNPSPITPNHQAEYSAVHNRLLAYTRAFQQRDTFAMADFYMDSFFTSQGKTRQQWASDLRLEMANVRFNSITVKDETFLFTDTGLVIQRFKWHIDARDVQTNETAVGDISLDFGWMNSQGVWMLYAGDVRGLEEQGFMPKARVL